MIDFSKGKAGVCVYHNLSAACAASVFLACELSTLQHKAVQGTRQDVGGQVHHTEMNKIKPSYGSNVPVSPLHVVESV